MKDDLQFFVHEDIENGADRTLFLLHGTGGSEKDLLFLNNRLAGRYTIVSLRGNVQEHGMNRFFKRVSPGIFDQDSLGKETNKLHRFIQAWHRKHAQDISQSAFLGFSNGANILLSLLFTYPESAQTLILLHPMLPFTPKETPTPYIHHRIFVSIGLSDDMVSAEQQQNLTQTMKGLHAELTLNQYPGGHGVQEQELKDVISFLS